MIAIPIILIVASGAIIAITIVEAEHNFAERQARIDRIGRNL